MSTATLINELKEVRESLKNSPIKSSERGVLLKLEKLFSLQLRKEQNKKDLVRIIKGGSLIVYGE